MFPRSRLAAVMSRGAADAPSFRLTCTTTGAQTLTLHGLTVAAGKTVTVDWGDGTSNTYTAGSGARTHNYAGAGTYTVKMLTPENITTLDLQDNKLSGTINSANPLPAGLTNLSMYNLAVTYNANTNPLPAGLTSLTLYNLTGLTYNVNTNPLPAGLTYLLLKNLTGLTYNVNTNPLPSGLTYLYLKDLTGLTYNVNTNPLPAGLTYLYLYNLAGLTWQINAGQPWPTGVTNCSVTACPNVTVSAWTDNAVSSIQLENAYSQAAVDAVINAIWANKANFTYATPSLDILGGSNAAPSGVYQAANPPTTGKEKIYDLVNGNATPAGPEWTVQYQA